MIVHIKELLEGLVSSKPKLSKIVKEAGAAALWESAVDVSLLKATEPIRVKDGVLYVEVTNSAFAQELSLKRAEIIGKINKLNGGGDLLKDIRFRTGLARRA